MNPTAEFEQNARRSRERLCRLLLGSVFVALAVVSWRKWTDVQVDFGLELYTPWQLAAGKVLYRDVSYVAGGPLSQYYHALLFRLFGPAVTVVVVSNLAITLGLVALLFRQFTRAADELTATLIGLLMLCGFAFGHLTFSANFNFITPYTCETVHGFALAVLALVALRRWIVTGSNAAAFATGLALGGTFLTKPEVFFALAVTVVAGAIMRDLQAAQSFRTRGRGWLPLALGAVLPVAGFALYFLKVWPTRKGALAAAGAWLPLLGGHGGRGHFYDWCMGLDYPAENLVKMLQYTAVFVVAVVALALAARFFTQRKFMLAGLLGAAVAGFLFSPANRLEWIEAGRALPLLTLAGGGFVAWRWWQSRREPDGERLVFPLLWAVFALLLLAKMGLNCRLWQYGFYLALPAATLLVYVAFGLLPGALERYAVKARVLRIGLAIFFGAGIFQLVARSHYYYEMKTQTVGVGGDQMVTYGMDAGQVTGKGIADMVNWLALNTSTANTLAVLPEGAMVNYLARRTNSTPYLVAGPHELAVAGERNVVAAYAAHPPDYVILMHRSASEFGVNYFGLERDYGYELMGWVKSNYTATLLWGAEPLQTNSFGIKLLRRNRL